MRTIAGGYESGCVVAASGLDDERREAIPVVVPLAVERAPGACDDGSTYLVVGAADPDAALLRVCADDALEPLLEITLARVFRCTALREEPIRDPMLGLVTPERLVELRALRI